MKRRPRVLFLYHFFHPDDSVSSRHFTTLAEHLAAVGWEVEALPSNRSRHDPACAYPPSGRVGGVAIRRLWRPPFSQSSALGRVANSAWMIARWSLLALEKNRAPDVVLVGTDPVLSVLTALAWKRLRPGVKVVHWAFDLYPEAAVADGRLRGSSLLVGLLRRLLVGAYRSCDLLADIGPCMRERLEAYGPFARAVTLTPWALVEPDSCPQPDPEMRRRLFGNAPLALLYSGNLGRAHCFEPFVDLARALGPKEARLVVAARGDRLPELERALADGPENVTIAPFVAEKELEAHLAAADIHLASLRPEWSGLVVPSKFFGSLAAGRPVVFAGPRDSAIARWISEHRVGWVIDGANLDSIARELSSLSRSPCRLEELRRRCHRIYRQHFSRGVVLPAWERELRSLVDSGPRQAESSS